jgi:hypothetical protein
MKLHIHHGDIHLLALRTRMPFKYGIATMTRAPHAFVRLEVNVEGRAAEGVAADHLPPKWFTKDPTRAIDDEVAEMLRVIDHAVRTAHGLQAESVFDAWRELFDLQGRWGRAENLPPLLTHFGTSLVERALIDAVCRSTGRPFALLLRSNELGVRLGDIHPSLAGHVPAEFLPDFPLSQTYARHTVGLADPLTDDDISAAERLDDGLPQSLAACIAAYGLRHFKIKVGGDVNTDRERLRCVKTILETCAPPNYAFSLDGNEQFHTLDAFRTFWEALTRDPALAQLLPHLLFVEQPLHRNVALEPGLGAQMRQWTERPPIIIDESDGELESLPTALDLGYAGTSHKNCKGVLKGVANSCLLTALRQRGRPGPLLMSGEDLANIGPVALLQDLAVCAALGIRSVERNGHHYFAGLSMFPRELQEELQGAHSDLYHPGQHGWPTLAIRQGMLFLQSVNAAPFGVLLLVDVEQFTPLAAWQNSPLH